MTERGMKEVVAGVFIPCCLTEYLLERDRAWQLLWPGKKGSFGWFWERKSKARGSSGMLFYLVEIGKSLGLFVCLSFKKFG
ncbi:hypothetical protein NC651_003383 [Populus alba x Populus x berolinensis]|nr:hypothetical protein NC651_003383 [Populus alba x Populus x berolinensis]